MSYPEWANHYGEGNMQVRIREKDELSINKHGVSEDKFYSLKDKLIDFITYTDNDCYEVNIDGILLTFFKEKDNEKC